VRVDDQRVGGSFRAVRIRRGWRQLDVAMRSGVSAGLVSLIERGHPDRISLRTLRRVGSALDIRLDLVARWRGGELDRLLNARHTALQDAVARWLAGMPGWIVAPEVSFAIAGERGWIDLLAWHAATRCLLVIEIKTAVVDILDLIGNVDRKVRLAPRIARDRGWGPLTVSRWVFLAEGPTNRRRIAAHTGIVRAAFPADRPSLRRWLREPAGSVAGLSFFSNSTGGSAGSGATGVQRVRRPKTGPDPSSLGQRKRGVGGGGGTASLSAASRFGYRYPDSSMRSAAAQQPGNATRAGV
jgi:transcriptional regulator with XRE-family HTH domain